MDAASGGVAGNQFGVGGWGGTMAIDPIEVSRRAGVVPLAIVFSSDDPLTREYYWSFGEGEVEQGPVASHVYDKPGLYTVTLHQRDPATGAYGVAKAQVHVAAFAGATYYVDATGGNDANSGTSPRAAWASIAKVQSHLMGLPSEARGNLRYLLKRGGTWTVAENGSWLDLNEVPGPVRFGSYFHPDGSDDASQPKPVIKDHPKRTYHPTSAYGNIVHCQGKLGMNDVTFENLKFEGNYKWLPPPGNNKDRFSYPTNAFGLLAAHNVLMRNIEVTKLGFMMTYEDHGTNLFIHDSYIHHNNGITILGDVDGYSVKGSRIEYATEGHLHYMGVEDGVVTNNRWVGSGIDERDEKGEHIRWMQCAFRLSADSGVRRVYVADNHFGEYTGTGLCIGQNFTEFDGGTVPVSQQILFERNVIDGTYTQGREYWQDGPTVTLDPARDVVFRNNALINARGGVYLGQKGDPFPSTERIEIYNNLFEADANGDPEMVFLRLRGDAPPKAHVRFQNNIVSGAWAVLLDHSGTREWSKGLVLSNNLYDLRSLKVLAPKATYTSFAEWQQAGFDAGSSFSTKTCVLSLDPRADKFLRLCDTSAAIDAGADLPVFADFLRRPRPLGKGRDIGPIEQR